MNVLIFIQSVLASVLLIIDAAAWMHIHWFWSLCWLAAIGGVWWAASRDFYIWSFSSR